MTGVKFYKRITNRFGCTLLPTRTANCAFFQDFVWNTIIDSHLNNVGGKSVEEVGEAAVRMSVQPMG